MTEPAEAGEQRRARPRIAVVGAGAVGCYFGGMLARAGELVTLIGRAPHVEAVARKGLFLESLGFQERIAVPATADVAAAGGADIVLLAVKTLDTETAARSLASHLASGAVVVSLQNGVDNVERIRSVTGIEALAAVVYVAAEMTEPGRVKHTGRGDLILGDPARRGAPSASRRADLERVAACFARAGVPCAVSETIEADLWTKMIMNCAYNAISALTGARYGRVVRNAWTREVLRETIEETVAVAEATGVRFPAGSLVEAGLQLGETLSEALSSTAQDIARGKRTEIDSLNGYVARSGAELGVETPVNRTLHALVKLREEAG
jgi:2-dehydropantoate 2-reductase